MHVRVPWRVGDRMNLTLERRVRVLTVCTAVSLILLIALGVYVLSERGHARVTQLDTERPTSSARTAAP